MTRFFPKVAIALLAALLIYPATSYPEKSPRQLQRSTDTVHLCAKGRQQSPAPLLGKGFRSAAGTPEHPGPEHAYDMIHLDIALTLDTSDWTAGSETFQGVVEMTAVSRTSQLSTFSFHLTKQMPGLSRSNAVSNITVDGAAAGWVHPDGSDMVDVTLPSPLASGDTVRVKVWYDGAVLTSSYDGGLRLEAGRFYTFGEPYGTRNWLACWDLPGDKVTSRMTVTTHRDYSVVSNGDFVSETSSGPDMTTTVWNSTHPISTYLIAVNIGVYDHEVVSGVGANAVPVGFWVYPSAREAQLYDMGRTDSMLVAFEQLWSIDYPFNKYDQVAAAFVEAGAMEHQTASLMGAPYVSRGDRAYESIVAHELAHQWWGDMVGPESFAEIWLNEGFATYSEGLWFEHLDGLGLPAPTLQQYMEGEEARYRFLVGRDGQWPLYNPPNLWTISYPKGAWVLHMLRWTMGDADFFEGLRIYGETHKYGYATTEDLKASMKQAAPAAMAPRIESHLNQWVYEQGHPSYVFSDLDTAFENGGTYSASVTLDQVQEDAPWFTTPLPLLFRSGEQTHLARVEQVDSAATQVLTVTGLPFPPTSMDFDPEGWVLADHDATAVGGSRHVDELPPAIVQRFELVKAWPNPFNGAVTLELALGQRWPVTLEVFDLLGRRVERMDLGTMPAGRARVSWTAPPSLASGVYIVRARGLGLGTSRRIVLVR